MSPYLRELLVSGGAGLIAVLLGAPLCSLILGGLLYLGGEPSVPTVKAAIVFGLKFAEGSLLFSALVVGPYFVPVWAHLRSRGRAHLGSLALMILPITLIMLVLSKVSVAVMVTAFAVVIGLMMYGLARYLGKPPAYTAAR